MTILREDAAPAAANNSANEPVRDPDRQIAWILNGRVCSELFSTPVRPRQPSRSEWTRRPRSDASGFDEAGSAPLTIAVLAHDAKKPLLTAWVARHRDALADHRLICTATTGAIVRKACPELIIETVKSGPLGGDQQIGALIAKGQVDALVFFPDPLSPQPHDADVKALILLALVYDVACAFNRRSADLLMQSGRCRLAERASISPTPSAH
jgi:methylglyoxal synthase